MSMCMHLRRISDADAARFRRDPATVLRATLGAEPEGRRSPYDIGKFIEFDGFNDVFARRGGLFGRARAWFVKRALKNVLRRQVEQLKQAHAAMGRAPSGVGGLDIPSPDAIVDLHKSWQVIHYVLTGTPDSGPAPLNVLLVGGEEVGDDLGYGPARIVNAPALRDFASALAAFDLESVLKRLDIERMASAGVYCVEDEDLETQGGDLEEDLRQYFPALKAFAEKAAAERQGALIWIS